jgi:hypothetical protein
MGSFWRKAPKTAKWFDDVVLLRIFERYYGKFLLTPLSYATVRDFCDSYDYLYPLATANKDLKDSQRPWVLKAIISKLPVGSRLLEIGAGEPFVADILSRLGYRVWVVDPYDGSGNGPRQFGQFVRECPNITFLRDHFTDGLGQLEERSFDCIFSISVLEHVPMGDLVRLFAGLRKFLVPGGISIHAIDHVHRGNGAGEHLEKLRCIVEKLGFSRAGLDDLLERMSRDTETYYLSAESHNRWRAGVPYDKFPMRVCVSIQIVADGEKILANK